MLQWGWTELLVTLTRRLLLLGGDADGPPARQLRFSLPQGPTQHHTVPYTFVSGEIVTSRIPNLLPFKAGYLPGLQQHRGRLFFLYSKKRAEYWKGALPNRWERECCDLTGGKKGVSKQQGWRMGPTECLVRAACSPSARESSLAKPLY